MIGFAQAKWLSLGALIVLTGCTVTNTYNAPVVDRSSGAGSIRGAGASNTGIVTAVDPSIGVTVTPMAPEPIIRSQRDTIPAMDAPVEGDRVPVSPMSVEPSEQNPAIIALLDTAKAQTNDGNARAAQTSLQRALRIAPKDPEVYYALADTHRQLGEFVQAEQVALKGVAVAQGQNDNLRRLWELIASIRNDVGDIDGADKASAISRRY